MASPTADFPPGFFERDDPAPDSLFYRPARLVTHLDDDAIAAVGDLYAELGIDGSSRASSDGSADGPRRVLDLMSSWVSHCAARRASSSCSG